MWTWFIGIDEAGYGPNLGPLVVGGTAFFGPALLTGADWWSTLQPTIGRAGTPCEFCIDDSKKVLARSDGQQQLLRTIHAALSRTGQAGGSGIDTLSELDPLGGAAWRQEPWCAATEPFFCFPDRLAASARFHEPMAAQNLTLEWLAVRLLNPGEFNARLDHVANKAKVEIDMIVELLDRLLEKVPPSAQSIDIMVDRLGGRKHYRAVVEVLAGNAFPRTLEESPLRSRYRYCDSVGRDVDVSFTVAADGHSLPVALASMLAKGVREACMAAFNAFWVRQLPGLAPTAGYPGDARRFYMAISPVLTRLGIAPDRIWRRR